MKALDGFNSVSGYYDALKRIVFGNAILESQLHYLPHVSRATNILILGGGTGEMLVPLVQMNPGSRIWYVEASSGMLAIAAKGMTARQKLNVHFIHGTQDDLPPHIFFDGIITNFFLDLFDNRDVLAIAQNLRNRMSNGGVWLATDFVQTGVWWQRILLWAMYRFFRIACKIEANTLPSWEIQLQDAGLVRTDYQTFYSDFISSCVFVKT